MIEGQLSLCEILQLGPRLGWNLSTTYRKSSLRKGLKCFFSLHGPMYSQSKWAASRSKRKRRLPLDCTVLGC